MALVVRRQSPHEIIPLANTPDYPPEQWLINPTLPSGVPHKYLKVVGTSVVEMTQQEKDAVDNPPETMAERHAREQQEGVTLANGWVMAYTKEARSEMGSQAHLLNLAGNQLPGVSFWEVDGTRHNVSVQTGLQVLADYAVKSATEVMRQYEEVSGG